MSAASAVKPKKSLKKENDSLPQNFANLSQAKQVFAYIEAKHPTLRRSQIFKRLEEHGKPLEEEELLGILIDLKESGAKISKDFFFDVLNSNKMVEYHPILDFFEAHKDRTPDGNIERIAKSLDSPTGLDDDNFYPEYVENFLRKWMVGVVATVHGEHSNLFPVLCGQVNTGKTEFVRRLLPKELKRFFSETKLTRLRNEYDLASEMCENLIVFDDEMADILQNGWAWFKSISDKKEFRARKPYGKSHARFSRLASFIGTTNSYEILGDLTGERRLIPIEVPERNSKHFDLYNSVDKVDLWMEAYQLYKSGFNFKITKEEITKHNACTRKFRKTDFLTDAIEKCFAVSNESDVRVEYMTSLEVAEYLRREISMTIKPRQLGVRMKALGFIQKQKRQDKGLQPRRCYLVKRL